MNLTDIVVFSSIIIGLISIPFLATDSLGDYLLTGKTLLGLDEENISKIPAKSSKLITFDKFERTYETAFGKFYFLITSDRIIQELSRPGTNVKTITTPDYSIWQLTTYNYILKVIQDSNKTIEEFNNADGSIIRIKQNGNINETFEGFNPEVLLSKMEEAELILNDEVSKMEEIKTQTIIPELGITIGNNITNNSEIDVNIIDINYTAEWVEIINSGITQVDMSYWTLSDSTTNVYTFPQGFKLNPESSVRIISGDGYDNCVNTPTTLCWKGSSVWNDGGDTAILKTNTGNIISTYSYP